MIPGIVYSWSRTIPLDELEMYQFFAILSSFTFNLIDSLQCESLAINVSNNTTHITQHQPIKEEE